MARHTLLDTEKIEQTIKGLSQDSFTVLDFTAAFKELYPQDWTRLVERLGELGQGRRYTVNTYLSNRLDVYSHKPGSLLMPFLRYSEAKFADYRKPTVEERKRFGSPWIAVFKKKRTPAGDEYYTSRKPALLEEFDRDASAWKQVLCVQHGGRLANAIIREARGHFERLIPEIPDIGGDENDWTGELLRSVRYLALYKAMRARGKTAQEAGKVLYDAVEVGSALVPQPIPPEQRLSPEQLMQRRAERAQRSQQRRYAGDFVCEFVPGDGTDFDYGYDFAECATQKFYHAQDADEFLPFHCFLDFPLSKAAGLGLARTMTLAEGQRRCNHRFKAGRETRTRWPPPFLKRD